MTSPWLHTKRSKKSSYAQNYPVSIRMDCVTSFHDCDGECFVTTGNGYPIVIQMTYEEFKAAMLAYEEKK